MAIKHYFALTVSVTAIPERNRDRSSIAAYAAYAAYGGDYIGVILNTQILLAAEAMARANGA